MKLLSFRVSVTAEDESTVAQVQTRLRDMIDACGTEYLTHDTPDDLGGTKPGPRVFWQTADVKQVRGPEAASDRRRARQQSGRGNQQD